MNEHHRTYDDLEHQRLVARCHALVAVIANKSSGTKLLKGILPVLEQYAAYKNKTGRVQRHWGSGSG